MSIDKDRDRLSQGKMLEWLRREPPLKELLTVCHSKRKYPSNHGIYCALIPSSRIERALARAEWDLKNGGGLPASVTHHRTGKEEVEYLRFGSGEGSEPLVIQRYFDGPREGYLEISEEFRLFHNLYHDRESDKYFKVDEAGREQLVADVTADRVRIRLQEIRQFLAIKEMHLSVQFDCKDFSRHSLAELGLEKGGTDQQESLLRWSLHFDETSGPEEYRAHSRLLGKRLISPLPKSKSGFPGFTERSRARR